LGVYYDLEAAAIGPDAFLSLGVPRFRENGQLRLSYVVWQENSVMPQWTLEIVSKTPGGEYDKKFALYQEMGVLYYVIFNPDYGKRDRREAFECYRLEQGQYVRQSGSPIWMPELGLGIGMEMGSYEGGQQRQWLYWYDEQGQKLPVPENVIAMERQRAELEQQRAELERRRATKEQRKAEQERQRAQRSQVKAEQERQRAQMAEQQMQELLERLRSRGIDPDEL
jgi:Putative restriction endonuclease